MSEEIEEPNKKIRDFVMGVEISDLEGLTGDDILT